VSIVADNPDELIHQKTFHCRITLPNRFSHSSEHNQEIPKQKDVSDHEVAANYNQIKKEVRALIEEEISRLMNTPELESLILK
jgi:hypothetical protein